MDLPDAPSEPQSTTALKLDSLDIATSQTMPSSPPLATDPPPPPDGLKQELFDDDSEDESSPSSSSPTSAHPCSPPLQPSPQPRPRESFSDPSVMRTYYQRLFPFRPLYQWLSHSALPTPDITHREFALTLSNSAYIRYQSYKTPEALKMDVLKLLPARFEIGPRYTADPRDRRQIPEAAFRPLSKELVFDIDMDGYDPIRTCCRGAAVCAKCWGFLTCAIRVLDASLRQDFAFRHILWVYSGRRGVHAWVCDRAARNLPDQARRSLAAYLELPRAGAGGSSAGKKSALYRPLHPHLERALALSKATFATLILQTQDPFASDEGTKALLAHIPDPTLRAALHRKWTSTPTRRSSAQKWADVDAVAAAGNLSERFTPGMLLEAKQDVVLEYTYPRLDAEVSKKMNHLLKSPFCIHPGTGRVCVPIPVRTWEGREGETELGGAAEGFDPGSVPTVTQLLGEIDEWTRRSKEEGGAGTGTQDVQMDDGRNVESGQRKLQDWEKTSIRPYVEYFRAFVARLIRDEEMGSEAMGATGVKKEKGAESMEF